MNFAVASLISFIPRPMVKPFAKNYVAGEQMEEALHHIQALNRLGFAATVDILGEHVQSNDEAGDITRQYKELLLEIGKRHLDCNLSIKPTHIGLDLGYDTANQNLIELLNTARDTHNFIRLDMENSPYTDATIQLYRDAQIQFKNIGPVIQAYLHRSLADIQNLNSPGFNVRICKGIYREAENIAYSSRQQINEQYFQCVQAVLNGQGYAAIATHDIPLIDAIESWIRSRQIPKSRFEFQVLYGVPMQGKLEALLSAGYKVRQYVPFGKNWYDYSMRRLKENPRIVSYVISNLFKKRNNFSAQLT